MGNLGIDTMFKTCTCCQESWDDFSVFLNDNNLFFNGYQPNFRRPDRGLFLFTHTSDSCKSTISVRISNFYPIFTGEINEKEFAPGSPKCPKFCEDEYNLEDCDNKECSGSFIRKLMQVIKEEIKNLRIDVNAPSVGTSSVSTSNANVSRGN